MAVTRGDLIIIYNADSSLRGKLNYAYRKLSSSTPEDPACAACDITHGGLSLKEVPNWSKTKSSIETQGWNVLQWHRDEVEPHVKSWIQEQGLRYPTVVARREDATLEQVADTAELADCAGDASKLTGILSKKGLIRGTEQASM
ncbi:hypothetical protein MBLNU230_g7997t1 [Neophaeotheca triangularis]